jgi:hypothetical protein
MILCTKNIWIVVFTYARGDVRTREQRVAAIDLQGVLDYFNRDAVKEITEIRKTNEEITYQY